MILNPRTINHWIFDLDNTLYPASLGIIEQAREAIMGFIEKRLSLSQLAARDLYRELHAGHHSALRGLVKQYGLHPKEIFDALQEIDFSHVTPDRALSTALAQLPGQKIIFTNATNSHAEGLLSALGIRDHFDHIYDIEVAEYVPKPTESTYTNLVSRLNINPHEAIFFEDVPRNLKPAFDLGMKTVFVRHNHDTKDVQENYIHHYIDDITEGLLDLCSRDKIS